MKNLMFFDTEKELQCLTGIDNRDELWNAGFNLDDWDFGVVSSTRLNAGFGHPFYEDWLILRMENYCCGYEEVEYEGRYYYLVYHS